MSTVDVSILKESLNSLRYAHAALQKRAYTEMGAPAGPMLGGGGAPPMDPNAMPPGGAPPMDPNAMPPMDPNAMPPGGAPPMDPNAMPPGGAPPMDPNAMPPMDPNAMPPGGAPPAGGISPELQQMLTQLADGMGEVATTSAEQQTAIDQLAKQQLQLEQRMQEIKDLLQGPLPADEGAAGEAPQQAPAQAPATDGAVAALGQM